MRRLHHVVLGAVLSKALTMQSAVVCTTVARLVFSCHGDWPHSDVMLLNVSKCVEMAL